MLRKLATSFALSISLAVSAPAFTQEDAATETQETEDKRLNKITVIGQPHPVYGKGMGLFEAGEYEAADIEFRRIAKRIKWGDEAVRTSASLASLGEGVAPVTNPDGTIDTTAGFRDTYGANNRSEEDIRKLDRGDIGFSHYMAGLSQIQLGQYKKAKKSLYSSLHFTDLISDAHFRVGLLELMDGREGKVEKQIGVLEALVATCAPNCVDGAGNDLEANLAVLKKGLTQLQAGELQFN